MSLLKNIVVNDGILIGLIEVIATGRVENTYLFHLSTVNTSSTHLRISQYTSDNVILMLHSSG